MLFDNQGTPTQRRAREVALVLIGSTIIASTLAAAGASGVIAYRRISPRHRMHVRLATTLAASVTAGGITVSLLDRATRGTRRRLSGIDRTIGCLAEDQARTGPAQAKAALSDAKLLARLERDIAIDAAYRAATASWCHTLRYDFKEGLLTSRDRWQGHPDGTASLPLVAGCTLHFEPQTEVDGSWCHAAFVLDDNGTRIEVSTPAVLLRHLTGQFQDAEVDEVDDADLYQEFAYDGFAVDADDGV
ncbi:hypothetical protein [Streptomyces noursei]|uniref:hypothetical protein n=1 Tax=Streptomyces noursei TaxID=1971 RepID=UPI0038221AC9